jgi:C4-dicarboxylate-specific signal transduction histidine kinase
MRASYEALVALNAELETRVHLRTVELEAANHDLAHAYSELKSTETQLVHTEKNGIARPPRGGRRARDQQPGQLHRQQT